MFNDVTAPVLEFASRLDGIEYLEERPDMWKEAAEKDLVVVFGYSDDCMEFRGTIDDEIGCWNGRTIFLTKEGGITEDDTLNRLDAVWCGMIDGMRVMDEEDAARIPWTYKTSFPCSEFLMYEDGSSYCRGIVFSLKSLK